MALLLSERSRTVLLGLMCLLDVVSLVGVLSWVGRWLLHDSSPLQLLHPLASPAALAPLYALPTLPLALASAAPFAASLAMCREVGFQRLFGRHRASSSLGRRCVGVRLSGALLLLLSAPLAAWAIVRLAPHVASASLSESLKEYHSDLGVRLGVDALQHRLQCCGVRSVEDWFPVLKTDYRHAFLAHGGSVEPPEETDAVPTSCCRKDSIQLCRPSGLRRQFRRLRGEKPSVNVVGCSALYRAWAWACATQMLKVGACSLLQLVLWCPVLRLVTTSMERAAGVAHFFGVSVGRPAPAWLFSVPKESPNSQTGSPSSSTASL